MNRRAGRLWRSDFRPETVRRRSNPGGEGLLAIDALKTFLGASGLGAPANIEGNKETKLIIALPPRHATASQLADLCAELRATRRGELAPCPAAADALNITETFRGSHGATYIILPGSADREAALEAYRHIRSRYPGVLDLLCMAAEKAAPEVTVEVGTLNRRDRVAYSHHNMVEIMPRILAAFRGRIPS